MRTPAPTYQCPRCRSTYAAESKFCGRCGAALSTTAAPNSDGASDGANNGASDDHKRFTTTAQISNPNRRHPRSPSDLRRRSSDADDHWLGRLVDDRYRVIEIVGRGGMGVVYKVEHVRMGKIAAMKVLHPEYSRDPEVIERFRREAEAVSRLAHPNTVQVFDFGTAHGALYLIMEYVRGTDLNALIRRDGPLSFTRAAPMLAQMCAALAEAHTLGIVHRDLKPENVLVTRTHRGRDFVKILDYGLAKLSEHDERSTVTDRGVIVGTPYYMSPEQIRGDSVDIRADIYALGGLMYRTLTGAYPFQAKTPVGVLTKHLTEPLIPPSERAPEQRIPPVIDALVARAMAKRPADRYPDVGALLDDIEGAYATLFDDLESPPPGAASATGLDMPEMSALRASRQSRPQRAIRPLTSDDSDIDYGIDSALRLRRSDLDDFERSLKRRRFLRVASVPLLLSLAAVATYYMFVVLPAAPRTSELEPNNSLDRATHIAPDQDVSGYLGQRISKSEPDRDYYRVELPEDRTGEDLVLTAHVTALPNIDIELSMLDATGKRLAWSEEFGVGGDEWLRRIRIRSDVYVLVTEAIPEVMRLPTENVSDSYQLTLRFDSQTALRESEPNDTASDAHPLVPGQQVIAHLDRRRDSDAYRFEGSPGRYRLTLDGPEELPMVWRLGDGPTESTWQTELELEPGALVLVSRSDAAAEDKPTLPGAARSYSIRVDPAAAQP